MTLSHKIMLLFVFMLVITFVTFIWFTKQMSTHRKHFNEVMDQKIRQMQMKMEKEKVALNNRRERLREEADENFKTIDAGMKEIDKELISGADRMIEEQNAFFDTINSRIGTNSQKGQ